LAPTGSPLFIWRVPLLYLFLAFVFYAKPKREKRHLEDIFMGKRILIVEDEDDIIEFVSAALEENGYAPVVARNGEEAMEMIRQSRPDLVIMDILMPQQSGIKMYRELKSADSLKDIPVIVYSGVAKRTFLRTQAARAEMEGQRVPEPDAYIEKPAKPEHLVSVVKKILV
jgi:twitching motility two-component system response regulator PilH